MFKSPLRYPGGKQKVIPQIAPYPRSYTASRNYSPEFLTEYNNRTVMLHSTMFFKSLQLSSSSLNPFAAFWSEAGVVASALE